MKDAVVIYFEYYVGILALVFVAMGITELINKIMKGGN